MLFNCVYRRNSGRSAVMDSDCFIDSNVRFNRHAEQDKRERKKQQQTLNFTLMELLNNIFSDYNEIFSAGRTMPEMEEMKKAADEFVEQSKKFIENEKKNGKTFARMRNKCYICNTNKLNY